MLKVLLLASVLAAIPATACGQEVAANVVADFTDNDPVREFDTIVVVGYRNETPILYDTRNLPPPSLTMSDWGGERVYVYRRTLYRDQDFTFGYSRTWTDGSGNYTGIPEQRRRRAEAMCGLPLSNLPGCVKSAFEGIGNLFD